MLNTKLDLITLRREKSEFNRIKLTSPEVTAEYIRQFYSDDIEIFESMFILMVNNSNTTIGYAKISQGGITGTVVDIRIICKYAIDCLATGIVICHNHPSGIMVPSTQDLQITKKLILALKTLDVIFLDHIILCSEDYYSMKDKGDI
jgi:DNA repair protein RadC